MNSSKRKSPWEFFFRRLVTVCKIHYSSSHIYSYAFMLTAVLSHWQLFPYVYSYALIFSTVIMVTVVPSYWQLYPNAELCSLVDSCANILTAISSNWIMPCLKPCSHVNSYGKICWQLCLQVDSWCPHIDSCCICSNFRSLKYQLNKCTSILIEQAGSL